VSSVEKQHLYFFLFKDNIMMCIQPYNSFTAITSAHLKWDIIPTGSCVKTLCHMGGRHPSQHWQTN